ncbi:hypothetical protein GCM10007205_27890 [Oxalicibacterium flavum]|uniref:DUF2569 domain-containing protein n=1 Tax=Oxalicibacterium flavum TaxID=179467 RepID=A0A8J2UPI8_9BURK|nr:DUF2569 family protein [Oxalicibacterium flavum]GGC17312.1 hypothetical protein GCM10007205_27890 [Oxalicibacterium flavum]
MAMKEGVSRVSKLISGTSWALLVLFAILGIVAAFNNAGAITSIVLLLLGGFLFAVTQGCVWVLDGFIGNTGVDSNFLWPRKRKGSIKNNETPYKPSGFNEKPLVGVGGWLMFLVASLTIFGPLRSVITTANAIMDAENLYPELLNLSGWTNYKITAWLIAIMLSAAFIWAGRGLLKHHIPASVDACIQVIWAAPFVAMIGDLLSAVVFLKLSPSDYLGPEVIGGVLQGIMYAAIWTAYLKRSRRVKNTYGTS